MSLHRKIMTRTIRRTVRRHYIKKRHDIEKLWQVRAQEVHRKTKGAP